MTRLESIVDQPSHRILAIDGDAVLRVHLPSGPFACLLWDDRPAVPSPEEMAFVSSRLLDAGCRFFVAGGNHAELWEGVFDEVLTVPGAYPHYLDVTTTSHSGESEDEVAFFFLRCAPLEQLGMPVTFLVVRAGDEGACAALTSSLRRHASPN